MPTESSKTTNLFPEKHDDMLTRRQARLYEDIADIYEPLPIEVKSGSKRMADRKTSPTPIATNVRGMYVSKSESADGGSPVGRSEKDLVNFTVDRWRCRADQRRDDGTPLEIGDLFVIHLKTSRHPDKEGWWVCQGGAKMRPARARRPINTQTVSMKKSLKPYGVE